MDAVPDGPVPRRLRRPLQPADVRPLPGARLHRQPAGAGGAAGAAAAHLRRAPARSGTPRCRRANYGERRGGRGRPDPGAVGPGATRPGLLADGRSSGGSPSCSARSSSPSGPPSPGTVSTRRPSTSWRRCGGPGKPYQLTPTALMRTALVTSGAITQRLDRLEEKGLITRERSEADGRAVVVTLTEAGREALDAALPDHLETERAAARRPVRRRPRAAGRSAAPAPGRARARAAGVLSPHRCDGRSRASSDTPLTRWGTCGLLFLPCLRCPSSWPAATWTTAA